MRDRDHVLEIDKVLSGKCTGRDGFVSASWRRCVETHGLDPTRPKPAHIVTDAKLREHREQSERLIAIARSGLDALFRQVAGQNYVLLLADAQGVTVDFFGDVRFEDDLRSAGLYLGSDWSEGLAGTCGVGSCIVTQRPVTIHQTDHFDLHHTPLSCTAAPIFDTSGRLAAVLDISLLRSPQPKLSQNLAMSLVCASARRVEMANLMAMTRRDWVLRFSTSPEFLEVDPEAAIALDGAGRIIGLTHGAQEALTGVAGPVAATQAPILGQPIEAFMNLTVDDLPELMRGHPTEERVIRLHDGRALFGHAIAPQTAQMQRFQTGQGLPGALQGLGCGDPAIHRVQVEAARLAATRIPLLITGETGTGKEKLARAIHVCQPGDRPFVTVNCAAIDPATLESAVRDAGQSADGGTLFLDDVGALRPEVQGGLLRLLAEGETLAAGAAGAGRVRLRAIAATQDDLAELVREGRFRRDLYFRLAGASFALPPLRLRHDFDWLLDRLLRQRSHGLAQSLRLSAAARADLRGRSWPGNIRELMNVLDVAVALVGAPVLQVSDLPPETLPAAPMPPDPDEHLEAVLAACGWNMADAARRLGVNRSTVLRRVRRSGLRPPD